MVYGNFYDSFPVKKVFTFFFFFFTEVSFKITVKIYIKNFTVSRKKNGNFFQLRNTKNLTTMKA